jgi:ketosteroid isomerase-like protein
MAQENIEVVRRLLDAFNRDDIDTVLAAFDEGCELDEPQQMPDRPPAGYRGPRRHSRVDGKPARSWRG